MSYLSVSIKFCLPIWQCQCNTNCLHIQEVQGSSSWPAACSILDYFSHWAKVKDKKKKLPSLWNTLNPLSFTNSAPITLIMVLTVKKIKVTKKKQKNNNWPTYLLEKKIQDFPSLFFTPLGSDDRGILLHLCLCFSIHPLHWPWLFNPGMTLFYARL